MQLRKHAEEAPIIETPVTSIVEAPVVEVHAPVIEVPTPVVEALAKTSIYGFDYTYKWHLASGIIVLATAGVGCYYSSEYIIKAGKWTLTAIAFVLGLRPDMDGDGDGDGGAAGATGATHNTQPIAGPSQTHPARFKLAFANENMAEKDAEADIQIEDQRTDKGKAKEKEFYDRFGIPSHAPQVVLIPPQSAKWEDSFPKIPLSGDAPSIKEEGGFDSDSSDTTVKAGQKTPTQVPMPDSRPDSPISPD